MRDTALLRHMKELADRGIVEKNPVAGGKLAYSIAAEYKGPVAFAFERINGP